MPSSDMTPVQHIEAIAEHFGHLGFEVSQDSRSIGEVGFYLHKSGEHDFVRLSASYYERQVATYLEMCAPPRSGEYEPQWLIMKRYS